MSQYLNYTAYKDPLNMNLVQIHIADLHFGAVDPKKEYDILMEQFITPIRRFHFDILSINGDIFDKRFPANHAAIEYAMKFVYDCMCCCSEQNATLIIIGGTEKHDAGQLALFSNVNILVPEDEIYIVTETRFVYTKGLKILCIPEEYGKGAGYYESFINQTYDEVFMHGALVGGFPGATQSDLNSSRAPVFSIQDFRGSRGPIIAGHVHSQMILQDHMYYLSSPIRYKFGEEAPKGYGITIVNYATMQYTYQFMEIQSFQYNTVKIEDVSKMDTVAITQYLDGLKASGIDYIRLDCSNIPVYQQQLISKYYRETNDPRIKLHNLSTGNTVQVSDGDAEQAMANNEILEKMGFLLDDNVPPEQKFVMFVNLNEGSDYITVDRLKQILLGKKS